MAEDKNPFLVELNRRMNEVPDLKLNPQNPYRQEMAERGMVSDPNRRAGFLTQAGASFASDDNEMMRYYAQELFPDDPIEESLQRFGQTKSGTRFFEDKDGQVKRLTPTGVKGFLHNQGQNVGSMIPAATGATVGALTTPMLLAGPGGLAASMGMTTAATGAGEGLRQKIGDNILGDASTKGLNYGSIAKEAAIGGLSQGVGAGINRLGSGGRVGDLSQIDRVATQGRYDRARRQGQRITPAEATQLQSLKAEQARVSNDVPAAANIMDDFFTRRADAVLNRVNQVADDIAPMGDATGVGARARDASQLAIKNIKQKRSRAAGPHYRAAQGNVDVSDIAVGLENEMQLAKGKVGTDLAKARELLNFRKTDQLDDTIQGLHQSKIAIDAMLEGYGDDAVSNTARRHITKTAKDLADRLKTSSREYLIGSQEYAKASPAVDDMVESVIGELSKMKNKDLHRVALKVLTPGKIAPEGVKYAKQVIQSTGKKGEVTWRKIQSLFIHQRAYKALKETQKGDIPNVPGKIQAQFGSLSGEMDNLKAAMDPADYAVWDDLMGTLRDMASSVNQNSDTAWKQESQRLARNRATPIIAKLISNIDPQALLRNTRNWLTEGNYEKQAVRLAQIFSHGDETALEMLKEIRRLPPTSRAIIVGHVMTRGGLYVGGEAADAYGN